MGLYRGSNFGVLPGVWAFIIQSGFGTYDLLYIFALRWKVVGDC